MIKAFAATGAAAAAGMIAVACALAPPAIGAGAGAGAASATDTAGDAGTAAAAGLPPCVNKTPATCYTPQVVRAAYGVQPLLDRGIDGRGVTLVLPEEAETGPAQFPVVTDIRQDLAGFDSAFGLPQAKIQLITTLAGPAAASPWLASIEEVLDTEMIHAVAPDATITELLVAPADVSTPANFATTWATAVRIAAQHGQVISQSGIGQDFNVGEDSFTPAEAATMDSALQYAAARHVTVVVASGDYGAIGHGWTPPSPPVKEVNLPTSDPLVLAVGGTSLTADPATGAYVGETAWNTPPQSSAGRSAASGGGFSNLFPRPAYQDGVPGIGATRGVPDVAGNSSNSTAMVLGFAEPDGTAVLTGGVGGTSAAAPFWAGLIALADQQAGHPLGLVNPAIYRIARGPLYHQAFHDVTTGDNTVILDSASPPVTVTGYQAGPGWDPVTGWGSPDARVLVPLLAG